MTEPENQMRSLPTLIVLGTQGWIPTPRRATTCLAYRENGTLLVFDAGTGLAHFLRPPTADLLAGLDQLHILMTHYHLDHSAGLSYISGLFPKLRVTVHVPSEATNGVAPEDGVPALIHRPFFPQDWTAQKYVALETVRAGDNEVAGIPVRVRAQNHADVSVGYRVGDRFAFVTDTVADPETADFAAGAQLLLHEAWIDGKEEADPRQEKLVRRTYSSHASARQAAELAARAGVDELYLIHLNPLFGEDYYREMERSAQAIFPRTCIPGDVHVRTFAE
jgi:ribonuclease BN (tRNA processing enzyme)